MPVTLGGNASAAARARALEAQRQRARTASLRFNLLIGCATAAALALWLGVPTPLIVADPEAARMLRGMAAIKAVLVLITTALLHWRLARPLSSPLASLYLLGTWLIAGASVMIWQLAEIPTSAFAFHLGAFMLLVTAWRDRTS